MSFKGHDISWLIAAISTTICVKNHVIFYSCGSGRHTVLVRFLNTMKFTPIRHALKISHFLFKTFRKKCVLFVR